MQTYKAVLAETSYQLIESIDNSCSMLFNLENNYMLPHLVVWMNKEQFDRIEKLGIRIGAKCLIQFENHSNRHRIMFE